jgi:hypothetical protein
MARPRIEIDWVEFDKLCAIHATQLEIASWFKCSVDTIDRAVKRKHRMGFAEYHAQKEGPGKISLRRKQFDLAQKGNVTMLIWLGKQYLGQSEKQQITADIETKETIYDSIWGDTTPADTGSKDT